MAQQPQIPLAVEALAEQWEIPMLAVGLAEQGDLTTTQPKETDQTDSRHLILEELAAAAEMHRPPHLQEERAGTVVFMGVEAVVVLDA